MDKKPLKDYEYKKQHFIVKTVNSKEGETFERRLGFWLIFWSSGFRADARFQLDKSSFDEDKP